MADWPPCDGEAASAAFGLNRPHIRDPILQSKKTTFALMDSKPVVEAANLLQRGKLSASSRMSQLINSFSGLTLDFRHNSGKLGHNDWDDFHSRNPPKCIREDCHTCKFLLDCASLTIGAVGINLAGSYMTGDILQGLSPLPFSNKSALKQLQEEDEDLRKVKDFLVSGQSPGRRDTKINDVKRYLNGGATLSKNNLIIVKLVDKKLITFERVIIPRSLGTGFLLAMHHHLDHPLPSQLIATFKRSFFTLDLETIVNAINENCMECKTFVKMPTKIEHFKPNEVPIGPGMEFTIDCVRAHGKVILVAVENFSGFVTSTLAESEKAKDLSNAIVTAISPLKSAAGANVRLDKAPGFNSLSLKSLDLKTFGIELNLGEPKNKNAVAIADQRIKELEHEIKKDRNSIDIMKLARATAIVNDKIRKEN